MAILLAYVDNGDGSGGTLTIVGSDPGSTNRFVVALHAGGVGSLPVAQTATRTGDGTVVLSLSAGPYHGFVINDSSGAESFSVPISFRVFETEKSVHERAAWGIRDYVLGLSLPGIPDDPSVHVVTKVGAKLETVVRDADAKEAVYYIPVPEGYRVADNQFNSVRFPVAVCLIKESQQKLVKGHSDILFYREKVQGSLTRCQLSNVCEIHTIEAQPGAVVDPSQWLDDYDASNFTLFCTAELPAGVQ